MVTSWKSANITLRNIPWDDPLDLFPSQTYFTVSKHIHCVCSSTSRRRAAFTSSDVHELLTLHLKDNSTICTKYVWTKPPQWITPDENRKTSVDPSLESSLKILIFVPTRSFGMHCCPPPFAKAGDINYTRHCAIRLFNAKAEELSVTYGSCICERPAQECRHLFNQGG